MRKAFVFIATLVAVLVAGVAFALMVAPDKEVAGSSGPDLVDRTTTTLLQEEKADIRFLEATEDPPREDSFQGPERNDDQLEPERNQDQVETETDDTPPEIVILFPEDGAHVSDERLAFEGKVEPGSRVFAAGYEADVSADGRWRIVLILEPGGNLATFTALDESGNEAQAQVEVYLDVEEGEKPKEEPSAYEFTAKQTYGSSAEQVPFDIWYGTGEPGTKIWIASEYGSATAVIGEAGKWDARVEFPEAPCGAEFRVVLETNSGRRELFEFTRVCETGGGDGGEK